MRESHYCCRLLSARGFDRWAIVAGGRIGVRVLLINALSWERGRTTSKRVNDVMKLFTDSWTIRNHIRGLFVLSKECGGGGWCGCSDGGLSWSCNSLARPSGLVWQIECQTVNYGFWLVAYLDLSKYGINPFLSQERRYPPIIISYAPNPCPIGQFKSVSPFGPRLFTRPLHNFRFQSNSLSFTRWNKNCEMKTRG